MPKVVQAYRLMDKKLFRTDDSNSHWLFDKLTPDERVVIAPLFKVMVYPDQTIIFTQGFPALYLYFLSQGEVIIRHKPDDGDPLTVARIQPGGVFGWSAALMRPYYSSSAITVGKTEVLRLHNQALRHFYQENPRCGERLVELLSVSIAERLHSPRDLLLSLLQEHLQQPITAEQ